VYDLGVSGHMCVFMDEMGCFMQILMLCRYMLLTDANVSSCLGEL
jgi:hypothetical protein